MPRVTIVGAGVFGLTIAESLPLHYDVTIVARDMPGDADTLDWASPWAGAGWGGGTGASPEEIEILRASWRYFWELSGTCPAESTVKRIKAVYIRDNKDTDEDIWWRGMMPDYRVMDPSELPASAGAKIAITYTSMVMVAPRYIEWLRKRVEAKGVKFVRATVSSFDEFRAPSDKFGPVPDVLINATGNGARELVGDPDVEPIRGQTILLRDTDGQLSKQMMLRSGNDYCYIIPRLDGTVIIGGIKDHGSTSPEISPEQKLDICKRAHELNPLIPTDPSKLDVVRDIVGLRPGRKSGLRVDSEIVDGLKLVHAYGASGGGFALSAGVGRKCAALVDALLNPAGPLKPY
ncbi:hypothetical protein EV122DRAFT_267708 [Schizophyllum commune]|nr:nucleotide-binding domain-containing protein [Schizophyllum commune Tattone D]